jgi:hypothetical protein
MHIITWSTVRASVWVTNNRHCFDPLHFTQRMHGARSIAAQAAE